MDCFEFRSAYSDFADGLLDELGEIRSHRHMSECPHCRRFHEALRWGVAELRRRPIIVPSADFAVRLERRLQAETSPLTAVARRPASAAAVLMAFTVVASGMFAYNLSGKGVASVGQTAAAGPLPVIGSGVFRPRIRYVVNAQAASQERYRYDPAPVDSLGYHGSPYSGQLTASWTGR
jgi:anti-sigma factor RsiW